MAAFISRGRSMKSRRLKGRIDPAEEGITLDYSKGSTENVKEILFHICKTDRSFKSKRLGYLNAFARLCYRFDTSFDCGISDIEILCCLRLVLLHDTKEIRSAALRALRYFCSTKESIYALLTLNIDYLIARSLDICLDNEIERIHAMKMTRKILRICPDKFPISLINVMISIANNGTQEHDKMVRVCLETLCELAYVNPDMVIERGGLSTIFKNILECQQFPRINESLLATVLFMLNTPKTRPLIPSDIGIEQLLAPFTDSHFKYTAETDNVSDIEGGIKYSACKMAIASLMKTWPGMIRLCKPDGTGLQSIIGVLYLPNMETRKEILDVLSEVFRLPLPVWTDEFSQALLSVDPSEMRDSWKLTEGFMAKEGISILPHLAQTRPNLSNNHQALLLSAFISAGLFEALVEVSTTSDVKVSIRAIILLGELLHMANIILPFECGYHTHCLPTLIDIASSFDKPHDKRNAASFAIKCLDKFHAMKKRGPVPNSYFLDQVLQRARDKRDSKIPPIKSRKEVLSQLLEKPQIRSSKNRKLRSFTCGALACVPVNSHADSSNNNDREADQDINQAIKDSQVLQTKENLTWDWELLSAILKWPDDALRKLEDQTNLRFVKRVLFYFKPENKLFSCLELKNDLVQKILVAGQHFLDFLLDCDNDESNKLLKDWLSNVEARLAEIQLKVVPSTVLFRPQNMFNNCTRYYFLLVGRLSGTVKGDRLLDSMGFYQILLDIITNTTHDAYIKLIISSLDYSREGKTRIILSKALTGTSDNCRLYCVQILRVLLRGKIAQFSSWGIELLVLQLYDKSKAIAMESLTVLSEACEDETNLISLINLRPSVLHLGYKGSLLIARFLSVPQGLKFLSEANYINNELERWHKEFNRKYVDIVEERLNEALTTYEKTYDGNYIRRSSRRVARDDVYVPVHLYGQLVQQKEGYQILCLLSYLSEYFDAVKYQMLRNGEDIVKVKTALWVVGHIGSSSHGIDMLLAHDVISDIIKLAEESGVFSIRGTAFFVLGLIACTVKGADLLQKLGWESVRHKRTAHWPVVEESIVRPIPDGGLEYDSLQQTMSRVSLTSGKSEPGNLFLPAVTLEQSPMENSSEIGVTDYKDSKTIASFSLGDENSSLCSSKERSSTINSASEVIDSNDLNNIESNDRPIKVHVVIESDHRTNDKNPADIVNKKPNLEKNCLVKNDLKNSDMTKARSSSSPSECDNRHVIHPRSVSDPRGISPNRLDSQTAVHFKNPDLSPSSILRKKFQHRSLNESGNEDAGISSQSDVLSLHSPSTGLTANYTGSGDRFRSTTPDSAISPGLSCDSSKAADQLSPITSCNSIQSQEEEAESRDTIHPSDSLRKLANLKRVPSTKRRFSNPVLSPVLKTLHRDSDMFNEYVLSYTSLRDVQGYATLRELKRQRTDIPASENDNKKKHIILEDIHQSVNKTKSLDFRNFGRLSSISRNVSSSSLQDMDFMTPPSSPSDFLSSQPIPPHLHKVPTIPNIRKPAVQSSGRPEYAGIALPVDVTMVFQINEGEDRRSHVIMENKPPKSSPVFSRDDENNDGLEHHHKAMCLGCYQVRQKTETTNTDDEDDGFMSSTSQQESRFDNHISMPHTSQTPSPFEHQRKHTKSRTSSLSEISASIGSNVSMDSYATKNVMNEETIEGRILIRKEIIRLIVNLSSSVGTKNSEQSLLMLKQKFSKGFNDVCLYSEICYMLTHYNYRLNARRFIQELFQDATFPEMQKEPNEIASELASGLGIQQTDELSETQQIVDKALEAIT